MSIKKPTITDILLYFLVVWLLFGWLLFPMPQAKYRQSDKIELTAHEWVLLGDNAYKLGYYDAATAAYLRADLEKKR